MLNDDLYAAAEALGKDLAGIDKTDVKAASKAMAHIIVPDMQKVRAAADAAEKLMPGGYYPYPTYSDMLYRVK